MTNPSRDSVPAVMAMVGDALKGDLRTSWTGAAIEYDGALRDGYGIWIRAAGSKYRLEIGPRAMWHAAEQQDQGASLIGALRAHGWIDYLKGHGCGFVGMDEGDYVLQPCPSAPDPSALRLDDP